MTTPADKAPEPAKAETVDTPTPAAASAKEAREQRINERKERLAAQRTQQQQVNPLLPQSAFNVVPVKPDIRAEGFKGTYRHIPHAEDPELQDAEWGLKINPNDPLGRTHMAKSEGHTWQGSEAEFRQNFEKA